MTGPLPASDRLARELAEVKARIAKLERGRSASQLKYSSLDDGALRAYDSEGKLRQQMGLQSDGTFAVTYANGVAPPMPTKPSVLARQLAIVVGWDGEFADGVARPGDFARVDVHMDVTPEFVPTGATLYGSLEAEGALSIPADYETHYIRLVAVTVADVRSEPTDPVEVAPLPASAISSEWVYAGGITADQIQSGELVADITLSSHIRTGDDGTGVDISSSGITVYDGNGSPTTVLPADPQSSSVFRGNVEAQGLTVNGSASFRGETNEVANNGAIILQSALSNPQTPPTVTPVYGREPTGGIDGPGLAWDGEAFCVGGNGAIHRVDSDGNTSTINLDNDRPVRALTFINGHYFTAEYVDGWTNSNSRTWRIVKYDPTGHAVGAFDYNALHTYAGYPAPMALGSDGTNLLTAEVNPSNSLYRFRVYNADTLALMSTAHSTGEYRIATAYGPPVGVARGEFDLGIEHTIVLAKSTAFRTFNINLEHDINNNWDPPSVGASSGFVWKDGRFYTARRSPSLVINRHSTYKWAGADPIWHFAYTWRDTNPAGGVHETALSPVQTVNPVKRAGLDIVAATLPHSPMDENTPTSVGFYFSLTDVLHTSFYQMPLPPEWTNSVMIDDAIEAGPQPPLANNFPNGVPGKILSSAGQMVISGDGTIRARTLEPLEMFAMKVGTQTIPSSSGTNIVDWTMVWDDANMFRAPTGTYVAPETGWYHCEFRCTYAANNNGTGMRGAYIRVNDVVRLGQIDRPAANVGTADTIAVTARGRVLLFAGDVVTARAYHTQGTSVEVNGALNGGPMQFHIYKVRDYVP